MVTSYAFSVDAWLKQHEFSSYHTYVLPDTEGKPWNATRRGNSWVPRSPDGFTLGNSRVLRLPQALHPQNLRSPQWGRIDDPVRYVKLASGEKELRLKLHPGHPVSRHMKTKQPDTSRHLTFV
jgi:hypothetical protein